MEGLDSNNANIRPDWCMRKECIFLKNGQAAICGGELPDPIDHDGILNTHRICIDTREDSGEIFDLQVNDNDLEWMRFVFDSLDGKGTSWITKLGEGN